MFNLPPTPSPLSSSSSKFVMLLAKPLGPTTCESPSLFASKKNYIRKSDFFSYM